MSQSEETEVETDWLRIVQRYREKNIPTLIEKKDVITTNKLSCGSCIHGYCDTSIGKCICEIGYTGKYCDSVKKSESRISGNKSTRNILGN